jgi:bleomycin hydrolase
MTELTNRDISKLINNYNNDSKNTLLQNIVTSSLPSTITVNDTNIKKYNNTYSHTINTIHKVSNQYMSGRCWMFSSLNLLRSAIINKYGLSPDFEFSESYLYFWDIFEKANYFLTEIIKTKKKDLHDDKVYNLLSEPIQDGGYWGSFVNLVNKYGLIPKSVCRETLHTFYTEELISILSNKLRQYAVLIRTDRNPEKIKQRALSDVFNVLKISLGISVTNNTLFSWDYTITDAFAISKNNNEYDSDDINSDSDTEDDQPIKKMKISDMLTPEIKDMMINNIVLMYDNLQKDKRFKNRKVSTLKRTISTVTPITFLKKHVKFNSNEYVNIINDPRERYEYNKNYYILPFIVGASPVKLYNLPIDKLKEYARISIVKGYSVWFSCDVQKYMYTNEINNIHTLDDSLYDMDKIFNIEYINITKAEKLDFHISKSVHAMILTGVNIDGNKTTDWKIENSWGKEFGYKGMLNMSDSFFEKYVYEVVIQRRFIDEYDLKLYDKLKPIYHDDWDAVAL